MGVDEWGGLTLTIHIAEIDIRLHLQEVWIVLKKQSKLSASRKEALMQTWHQFSISSIRKPDLPAAKFFIWSKSVLFFEKCPWFNFVNRETKTRFFSHCFSGSMKGHKAVWKVIGSQIKEMWLFLDSKSIQFNGAFFVFLATTFVVWQRCRASDRCQEHGFKCKVEHRTHGIWWWGGERMYQCLWNNGSWWWWRRRL